MRGKQFERSRWTRLLRHAAVILAVMLAAGTLFVWSGVYNVAASDDHWALTNWLIERVRVRSVATWSAFVDAPPPLEDPDLVGLGAAHFEGACTPCHSRPGDPRNAIVAAMLPPPPPLSRSVPELDTSEIFWIVKHGLKFTAMPAWPSRQRDDEVWAVTAFLLRLPDMSQQGYLEASGVTRAGGTPKSDAELAQSNESLSLTECVRCHGDASRPPLADLIPVLNGQPRAYLERALDEYAARQRESGIMQPVSSLLRPYERRRIAGWYAGLEAPPKAREESRAMRAPAGNDRTADRSEAIERGRTLAHEGDREQGLPPCLACHAGRHPENFPTLAGQSAAYLESQLRVFRGDARNASGYGEIMTVVARRLTPRQIGDVARFFASLPPGDAPAPAEHAR
ncbi:MAG TPA: c-type cytochrome [Woeseiaceae bacterium]